MKTKHDGDCWIYAINGVCTCGYLHKIIRNPDSDNYNNNYKDIEKHEKNIHYLNNLKIAEQSEEDKKLCKELLDKMFE